jgi:hypothetical protein
VPIIENELKFPLLFLLASLPPLNEARNLNDSGIHGSNKTTAGLSKNFRVFKLNESD